MAKDFLKILYTIRANRQSVLNNTTVNRQSVLITKMGISKFKEMRRLYYIKDNIVNNYC